MLILRPRLPITSDLHPRSLLTKIIHYKKVVNVPNSITVFDDLLPIAVDLIEKKKTGIYNFCNPGCVPHNFVLALYKKHIDPNFTWQNFTVEEQSHILAAPRSNNYLNTDKLEAEYPDLLPIDKSLELLFIRLKNNLNK